MYPGQYWSGAIAAVGVDSTFEYWATDAYGNLIGNVYTAQGLGDLYVYSGQSTGYFYIYIFNPDYVYVQYIGISGQICNVSSSVQPAVGRLEQSSTGRMSQLPSLKYRPASGDLNAPVASNHSSQSGGTGSDERAIDAARLESMK
jgi:hypothetical protein